LWAGRRIGGSLKSSYTIGGHWPVGVTSIADSPRQRLSRGHTQPREIDGDNKGAPCDSVLNKRCPRLNALTKGAHAQHRSRHPESRCGPGIGLLIGAERERRKGEGPSRSSAGIRTFAVTSLAGAVSFTVGGDLVLAVTMAGVIALTAVAYWRAHEDDPGLTSEVALILTTLLGGLSMRQPALVAGVAVTVAILLAARTPLHHFVRSVLTEREVNDALILAGATLVVLPLLPDRPMGPEGALNPHTIWVVVILIMAIGAAGHVAVRVLGARFGLPIAGLASGFVSSTATIGAMGARATKAPDVLAAAVSGAVLSSVATIVQLAAVLTATSVITLRALSGPLLCAGLAAAAYGTVFTIRALRQKTEDEPQPGQAFSLSTALVFALTLSGIIIASAALREWFGEAGVIVAAAAAGFATRIRPRSRSHRS
jgi:uncharacterized membrane protein (DUF4010 family)